MKNIFENAYFGKPYLTRDKRVALYITNGQCIVDGEFEIHSYCSNGNYSEHEIESGLDIVSECRKKISDYELNELANEFFRSQDYKKQVLLNQLSLKSDLSEYTFKAAYRKSEENIWEFMKKILR